MFANIESLRSSIGAEYNKPQLSDCMQYTKNLNDNSIDSNKALDYLKIQKNLSEDTISNFQIGYDYYRNYITIPEHKSKEIVNIAYRSLEEGAKEKYKKEKGCENWIFNEKGLDIAREKGGVLIVSNQFDAMSAWQAGFKNVVSVPVGKDSTGSYMELFDSIPKVYICFENTKLSKKYALEFATRIGVDKCYEVLLPTDIQDINAFFKIKDSDEFKNLIRESKPYYKYKFKGLTDIIESLKEKVDNTLSVRCLPYIEFEEDWLVMLSGVSNSGKCHGKGTRIMMSDGSIKLVEDIIVGDELMGADSKPRKVLSLARGKENMYRVHEREDYYDVNESHILSLQSRTWQKRLKYSFTKTLNISVKNYLKLKPLTQRHYRGWKTKVSFNTKDVTIEPYFLGLWLGDGTSDNVGVTTADTEIKEYIENYGRFLGMETRVTYQLNNASNVYTITSGNKINNNPLLTNMQKYNLIGNKHIPFDYKTNSEQTRLQVLAGLIDTDGYLADSGRGQYYEIIQKNTQLSNDIVYLARSLGYRAVIKKCIKKISSIGFSGEYNRITIIGDLGRIPVRLERKKSNFIPKKQWLTSLLKIESLGYGDYYGFTLDGDGLYLLDTFTVTHNTTMALNIAQELSERGYGTLIMPFERGIRTVGKRFLQVYLKKNQSEINGMNESEWDKVIPDIVDLPLYFSVPNREEIKDIVARSKKLFNTKVIIVDHLDYLVRKSGENHNVETSNTLQEFKSLAQEFNIIFIIVHHIKKQEGVGSSTKKPKMEDLKGSSSTYQDPEAVIMLSSPEKGLIEVDIVKNKGQMGSKIFEFDSATGVVGKDMTDTPELEVKMPNNKNLDMF